MRIAAAVSLLLAALPLANAEVVACRRDGNRFQLELSDGTGEIEWISPSAFRVSREWTVPVFRRASIVDSAVDVSFAESATGFEFRSRYITVRLDKADARLSATSREGKPLFRDLTVTRSVDGIRVEKSLAAEERFFGLGIRQSPKLDLRGTRVQAGKPFLISSAGYGEFYRVPANYVFDLGAERPDVRSVMLTGAHRLEYFVYYGPEPKQILEEHLPVAGSIEEPEAAQFAVLDSRHVPPAATIVPTAIDGSWDSLRDFVYSLGHAGVSGVLLPDFDLTPYLKAPAPVRERASQLAGVLPLIDASTPAEVSPRVGEIRKRMLPILISYGHETRDRGLPTIHPMPMQFPRDKAAIERADQFMVGDELLAAPILGPEARRTVYLPMGQWTELRTNKQFKGRQTIEIEAGDELPLFAKSGSIVPLAPVETGRPLELHYYPNIGGEFFLYEPGSVGYSQIHAGPAGDVLRLEIEAVAAHGYEWIVHHAMGCRAISAGQATLPNVKSAAELKPGTWFFDERSQSLHVRVDVKTGDDLILNISN